MDLMCEPCGAPAVGVCCSGTGPYSTAYCRECLDNYTEPYWTLLYLYYDVGTRGQGLAEWVSKFTTVRDGHRITWAQFDALQQEYCYLEGPVN